MFAKHSVKRPYTVFVAVVLVLVLGVISFFGMTTDLLPSLELPYVIVMTTYVGASPEKVELAVTKPLESVLGTTSGLSNISSISQENSSMIILEYEQGTNMDSAMIELSDACDLVAGQLDDAVGSPMLLKISPDMMPIMVASVDMDGMDTAEISDFVTEVVSPAFERLDGVASVTPTGLIEEQVTVTLDQAKIDALNDKVLAEVDGELGKAQREIRDGKQKLTDGKQKLAEGKTQLTNSKNETFTKLSELSALVDSAAANLSGLKSQLATLEAQRQTLNSTRAPLAAQVDAYHAASAEIPALAEQAAALGTPIPGTIPELVSMGAQSFNDTVAPVLTLLSPDAAARLTYEQLVLLYTGYEASSALLPKLDENLAQIDQGIAQLGQGVDMAQQAADQYAKLESGKMAAVNELTKAEVTLSITEKELTTAEEQLKTAEEQLADARDAAYKKADLSGIVTKEMISNILMAQNFSMPAGYITEGTEQYLVKIGESFSEIDEVKNALLFDLGMDSVGEIRLSDVASIEKTDNVGEVYAKINGNDGVILSFQKQNTASTTEVTDRVNKSIQTLEAEHEGLHITPLMDQGQYIHFIINSVLQNLMYGGILAILVLIFFLKDAKPTFIIACSIPISLLFAVMLMYFSGVNLNIISLSGLALGVGMLVDNSIVVIENIYRLRSRGMPAAKAAVQGANQVGGAIFASTLTTVCVFLPIVFTQGLSRQLFTDMGLTIAYSLLASLVVALTLVPAMSATVLRDTREKEHKWFDAFTRGYEKALRWSLGHRAIVLLAAAAMLCLAIYGAATMGTAFMPTMDSPEMSLTMTMPKGAEQKDTYAMSDEVMERVAALDGVATVGAIGAGGAGPAMMMGGGAGDGISMYILLDEERSVSNTDVEREIYAATEDLDCTISVTASSMDMSALGGSGISVVIKGRDLDTLAACADDVAALFEQTEGTSDISTGRDEVADETRITVDKNAAMKHGLTVAQVFSELAGALKGESTATTLTVGTKDYPVIVVAADSGSITRETIGSYEFTTTNKEGEEETFTLSEIASVAEVPGVSSIKRDNQSRYVTVSAGIADGYNIGLVSRDFEKALATLELPDGYSAELTGENESITSAMIDLVKMISLAIVFIYLIMVAQFQSLLSPFIVLFTMPLAFTGGLLLLWASGKELSVIAMLGFLVLAGVVVNNGIVFVDYANQLRLRGMEKREALIKCGRTRLRPILMTALTTILAMSTMALGLGEGAEMSQPMAIVTIGGLGYATVLTLIIVPIMYDLLCRKELKNVALDDEEDD